MAIYLEKLKIWFEAILLILNKTKNKFVLFYNKKDVTINGKLKIGTQERERKKAIKFLGVIIDECLQWKDHTNYVFSKTTNSLVLIRDMKYILRERDLKKYYSMV